MKKYKQFNNDLRESTPNQTESYYTLFDNLGDYIEYIIDVATIKNVEDIFLVAGGLNAAIVRVKCHNAGEVKVKIPSDKLIFSEVFFLKQLKAHAIPAPKVLHYSSDCRVIPYPFMVTEWISNAQTFYGRDEETLIDGGRVYAEALHQVHQIPTKGFGMPLDAEGITWSAKSWTEALTQFLGQTIKSDAIVFSQSERRDILALTVNNDKLNFKNPSLIHGDPPNGLMRITPTVRLLGLFDPSSIVGGSPLFDWTSIYCINENGDLGTGFMKGMSNFSQCYTNLRPVPVAEHRLFHFFWKTCYFYDHGWEVHSLKDATLKQLRITQRLYSNLST